jgi:hypothetical protein
MSFLRPIQWYHSQADPIWTDGTLKEENKFRILQFLQLLPKNSYFFHHRDLILILFFLSSARMLLSYAVSWKVSTKRWLQIVSCWCARSGLIQCLSTLLYTILLWIVHRGCQKWTVTVDLWNFLIGSRSTSEFGSDHWCSSVLNAWSWSYLM